MIENQTRHVPAGLCSLRVDETMNATTAQAQRPVPLVVLDYFVFALAVACRISVAGPGGSLVTE